jgi:low temperature requirement protein LtrA
MYFARFDADVFDWALAGGLHERRRSFVFGYGHLVVFAALTAVGVGVKLAIEEAIAPGEHAHAAVVLGLALAVYVLAVQRGAPGGVGVAAVVGRCGLVAVALALALLGAHLGALALVGVAAGALAVQTVAEAVVAARE